MLFSSYSSSFSCCVVYVVVAAAAAAVVVVLVSCVWVLSLVFGILISFVWF